MVSRAVVSAGWLSSALRTKKSLRVVDNTLSSTGGKDPRKEFVERHIPGSSFFDMDLCRDRSSPYEMMMPSRGHFAEYVGSLGIGDQSHVVVYDRDGLMYAPRLWWMFRVFGHKNVSVLDGGLVSWARAGLPVTTEETPAKPQRFTANLDRSLLRTFEDIRDNLNAKTFQLVDARGEGRYWGPEPKPGEGIEPGHIPGSVNLPFSALLTPEGFQHPPHEIRRLFQDAGVDVKMPMVATCRRGVTACHLALSAFVLGKEDVAVYDGSWSEWFHRAEPHQKVFKKRD